MNRAAHHLRRWLFCLAAAFGGFGTLLPAIPTAAELVERTDTSASEAQAKGLFGSLAGVPRRVEPVPPTSVAWARIPRPEGPKGFVTQVALARARPTSVLLQRFLL